LWRTRIGSADTLAGGLGNEITHNLLTLVGDRLYFNTNLGLVAALDANNGQVCWLTRYPRLTGKSFSPGADVPLHFDRDPSPCVYHNGLVVVAPSDTPDLFALDAETGKFVWVNHQLPDALHLLGVIGRKLVVSGNRISTLDLESGKIAWNWPESSTAGIRGMGRGLVAGNEIFWPTRTEIYALDPESGARTRTPISLSPVSDCGANLAVAGGRLIAAGYDKLIAFGTPTPAPEPNLPRTPTGAVQTSRLSDQFKSSR
jgi:outer membrane protein assembly factor BamB